MKAVSYQDNAREAWRPGVETRMLISASNGAAQLCIFEQWVAPAVGAPTHSHPVEEVLTVREGEAEMWIDEERVIPHFTRFVPVPSKIISSEMSAPQNSVRLVDKRWFATGMRSEEGRRYGEAGHVESDDAGRLRRRRKPRPLLAPRCLG